MAKTPDLATTTATLIMNRLIGLLLASVFLFSGCVDRPSPDRLVTNQVLTDLDPAEREVLTQCFRNALTHSQLAAVLFGQKPVCIDGMVSTRAPNFMQGSAAVVNGELFTMGVQIWEKLGLKGPNYSMVRGRNMHPGDDSSCLCIWVNHHAVKDVVTKHLPMFQVVLGQDVTPERLLEQLTTPGSHLPDIVRGNEVLIGLLMGFGLTNSHIHETMTHLRQLLTYRESVPLSSRYQRLPGLHDLEPRRLDNGLAWIPEPINEKDLRARIDFTTLGEEYRTLSPRWALSCSHHLANGSHVPWFGCDPNSAETTALLKQYVMADRQAKQMLASKSFLEDVTQKLCS